jgi:glycosyltransferase involved in cell wall biosynthesis
VRAALVSILTPSLNQGRFIGDCLTSVAAQTYRPLEHVICDGGSSDSTIDLLRRAPGHVRWLSEADSGQGAALNRALALSDGDIVGWLNADDAYVDRRAVMRAVNVFAHRRDVDVVFGGALLINEENRVLEVHPVAPFSRRLYRFVHYVIQPTAFFRREALQRESMFVREDLRYVIDRDLFFRLARHARFGHAPGITAADRHQRDRKVLEAGFGEEAEAFDRTMGLRPSTASTVLRRLVRVTLRVRGLASALLLQRLLEPAIDIDIPSLGERIRLQLLTPRSRMPF